MKNLFIILLILLPLNLYAAELYILPLKIETSYKGSADLKNGLRNFIAEEIKKTGKLKVILNDSYPPQKKGYVLSIELKKYMKKMTNFDLARVGGYRSIYFEAGIGIEILNLETGRTISEFYMENNSKTKDYGFTINKDIGGSLNYKKEFGNLFNIDFLEDEFKGTIIYSVIEPLVNKISARIHFGIFNRPYGLKAEVIEVDGKEIFLNAGLNDNITEGDTFTVYRPVQNVIDKKTKKIIGKKEEKRRGILKVILVKNERMCFGVMITGTGNPKVSDIAVIK